MSPDVTAFFIGLSILGVVLLGFGFVGSVLNFRKDESKDNRIAFFRKVEEAREVELLEKKPVQYDVSGIWRGIGASYFGIGRNLEFDLKQHYSEVKGTLSDNFGTANLQGYFVWPYIWFDVKRDVTVFEFRGEVKESAEGSSIEGFYRYLSSDAPWTVQQIAKYTDQEVPDDATGSEKSGKKDVAVDTDGSEAVANDGSDGTEPSELEAIVSKLDEASSPSEPSRTVATAGKIVQDRGSPITTEIDLGGPSRFGGANPGKCADCGQELEEMLSFCIYCGRKKGAG